ncbi:MAG TPA: D-alanyl-D-alanine carboxypeptidase, partial [Chitinophagaceae bacterium]|nr:D-alanyl-D-alanine carboxypeptidase [Chitinophagaceae bacterium]
MKWLTLSLLFITQFLNAQNSFQKLDDAFKKLSQDSSYSKADISFALRDTKTGKLLYAQNKDILLAPASTLKTFTTASALNILGEDYKYQTKISFRGIIKDRIGFGDLIIRGSGDPSFGSDRYPETKPDL